MVQSLGPEPNLTLLLGRAPNVSMFWALIQIPTLIPAPNVIQLCKKFVVPNVIPIIGLILVTAPNAFPDGLFINSLCAHVVFQRSTDRE